jgi:methenyltetrahydromethanopterin cyclohydrolase
MWIHKDAVPRTATDVDRVICAEIPNETTDPLLYATVTSSMMHGPCGRANPNAPCCKETSECAKKFSKPFTDVTKTETDGYPVYRRRGDGQTVVVKDVELDDRYVVGSIQPIPLQEI